MNLTAAKDELAKKTGRVETLEAATNAEPKVSVNCATDQIWTQIILSKRI